MQKKHMIIWFIINLIASLIAPLIFSFAVVNENAVLKIYMPFIFVIVGISWIAELIVYIGSVYENENATLNNMFPNDKKWTTEEIVEECKNVIDQIVDKYCK